MTAEPHEERPEWWIENDELREFLGLPEYNPPRFADKVYTHEVIPKLEAHFDCTIRPIGIDTEYLDDWEIRVDDEVAFMIGRHRDESGNTVYEMDADEFRDRLVAWFDENKQG